MRRYGAAFESTIVPGNDAGLRMTMNAVVPVIPPCTPKPDGLFWFSDATGDFTEVVEVASVGGPILALAKVTGETCQAVTWTWEWFPTTGTGGAPGAIENGSELCVYPLADTVPGRLEVSASCVGSSFGPILLSIESCMPKIDRISWIPENQAKGRYVIDANGPAGLYVAHADFDWDADPLLAAWCCGCTVEWILSWYSYDTEIFTDVEITETQWTPWNGIDNLTMVYIGPDTHKILVATYLTGVARQVRFLVKATVNCGGLEFGPFQAEFDQTVG